MAHRHYVAHRHVVHHRRVVEGREDRPIVHTAHLGDCATAQAAHAITTAALVPTDLDRATDAVEVAAGRAVVIGAVDHAAEVATATDDRGRGVEAEVGRAAAADRSVGHAAGVATGTDTRAVDHATGEVGAETENKIKHCLLKNACIAALLVFECNVHAVAARLAKVHAQHAHQLQGTHHALRAQLIAYVQHVLTPLQRRIMT